MNTHQKLIIVTFREWEGGARTITCYLTCTQLPSLNFFQHACINYEFKKNSNTFFAPNLSPALRRPVSHAPSGPGCSDKQTPPGIKPRVSGPNSHLETMKNALPQNRDFIYTLYLHSGLRPTWDDCPGR